jgi:hypothetical protein
MRSSAGAETSGLFGYAIGPPNTFKRIGLGHQFIVAVVPLMRSEFDSGPGIRFVGRFLQSDVSVGVHGHAGTPTSAPTA